MEVTEIAPMVVLAASSVPRSGAVPAGAPQPVRLPAGMGRAEAKARGETRAEAAVERLNDAERAALAECENTITSGRTAFQAVGRALIRIREGRLYKSTFADFEEYCRQRWRWSKTHVNRLIAAAEVMENLAPIGVTALPANEAQARPLAALVDPEDQRQVWLQVIAAAGDGPITAALVAEQVREWRPDRSKGPAPRVTLPRDPVRAAARVFAVFPEDELAVFLQELERLREPSAPAALAAAA